MPRHSADRRFRAFTLVEILIVVVILGILAAIVVPQFSQATDTAQKTATFEQLMRVRRAVDVYYWREANHLPEPLPGGVGAPGWGPLISADYLREPPVNTYVGRAASKTVILGAGPDAAYQTTHGWIYNPGTGEVWAGGFGANDEPLPRP